MRGAKIPKYSRFNQTKIGLKGIENTHIETVKGVVI